ncbi:rhomboid family intramembrane serine protease [Coraliomargarita parva]|uniref:rhomboid family intramembrane serine protease n=1 Tax=Coraliomargarita parva TaxID=3014050 RepID=UPI0022B3BC2B|nr:rhomboid family intramembrane serine protease [Coraliomargarita parva]
MLNCPNCRSALVHCQNEFGNVWHCGQCKGTALTVSLLRKLADGRTINQLWQLSRQNDYPRLRDCPGCNNRMEEVPLNLPVGLRRIDVCERCQFIWLDAGEWDDLPTIELPAPRTDPVREAPMELREKIALQRLRRMEEKAQEAKMKRRGGPEAWWQWIPGLLKLPVEEAQPTLGNKPVATWGLALLIFLISLLSLPQLAATVQAYGLIPAEPFRLAGLTLLSSFFLHAGLFHLLGNLYFLLVFGDNVEHFLGPLKFLFLVIGASLGGDLLHILLAQGSTIPCIGASGGISGVMAYYALKFPKARISFMLLPLPGAWLRLGARWMFLIWIAQQAFIIWQQSLGLSQVSGAAHIGGALVGLLTYFFGRLKEPEDAHSTRGSIFER